MKVSGQHVWVRHEDADPAFKCKNCGELAASSKCKVSGGETWLCNDCGYEFFVPDETLEIARNEGT